MSASRRLAGLALLLLVACQGDPNEPVERDDAFLAAILFYRGHVVGRENLTAGLQVSRDRGASFTCMSWPQLNLKGIDLDASGRWLYLACGNGVLVSRDAGQSWWLTGGITLTEVQAVRVDRGDPRRAWAASGYGVFWTDDVTGTGNPWRHAKGDFRFCSDVVQDRRRADRLLAGTEVGVFRSEDRGRTFVRSGPEVAVRRVLQDPGDARRFWAATDGGGLQVSTDGGRRWRAVPGTDDVTYCVARDARGRIFCGSHAAVLVSRDGGRTFERRSAGLPPELRVYDIEVDPADPRRVLASGSDGVFESRDDGRSWQRLAFAGALVHDMRFASLARVPRAGPSGEPGALAVRRSAAAAATPVAAPPPALARRKAEAVAEFARRPARSGRISLWSAMARVRAGEVDDSFWPLVRAAYARSTESMFFALPAIAFYLTAHGRMPEDLRRRVRGIMTGTRFYRGDTENHWVMHYTALLLSAQTWPETSAAEWYTGRTTQENYDEARAWLDHWMRLTVRRGQGEFDSPHYVAMFLTPLFLLHDYAADPELRRKSRMMIDLLLADYLTESLAGAWCGGHSRIGPQEALRTRERVAGFHWLFAGGIPRPAPLSGWTITGACSSYVPPPELAVVANERRRPFVHRETKRVRNVMRYGEALNPPVHKYTYLTDTYGLGSLQGGLLQPVQQHTWDVTWRSEAPNATLFAVHPYSSGYELGMFFPEDPHIFVDLVDATKKGYASPDKWTAASPYERVWQHENVLLAMYRVPEDYEFRHVSVHVPHCLGRSETGGWIFGRDGGFFVALFPCQKGSWEKETAHDRLRCPAGDAGFVVVCGHAGEELPGSGKKLDFATFRERVLRADLPELVRAGDSLVLDFKHPDGRRLRLDWKDGGQEIGEHVQTRPARLFDGPFLQAELDTGVIRITDGETTRVLDFR